MIQYQPDFIGNILKRKKNFRKKKASPVARDSLNLSLGASPKLALREKLDPSLDTSWNGWIFEGWGRLKKRERARYMACPLWDSQMVS